MAEMLSPTTRITKVRKGPIAQPGTTTSVAGIEAVTERGPAFTPTLVTSILDFEEVFGEQLLNRPEAVDALAGFFDNHGRRVYVNRVVGAGAQAATRDLLDAMAPTIRVTASSVGAWGNDVRVACTRVDNIVTAAKSLAAGEHLAIPVVSTAKLQMGDQISIQATGGAVRGTVQHLDGNNVVLTSPVTLTTPLVGNENVVLETFNVVVFNKHGRIFAPSPFNNLRMSPLAGPRHFAVVINNASRTPITVEALSSTSADARPQTDTEPTALSLGADGAAPTVIDYVGSEGTRTGVWAWDKVNDVNFISVPGVHDHFSPDDAAKIMKGVEVYCESRADVQCVFTTPRGADYTAMQKWVTETGNFVSMYMNVYGPYVYAIDRVLGVSTLKDPTGRVMGAIARTHQTRNFGKAPAGIVDGQIRGIYGLEFEYREGSTEYDTIFPAGINLILNFPGEGFAIWGDATLDATHEFGSVSMVTVFNIAQREIARRTRFVNFEPNDMTTRSRVTRVISSLFRQWREDGILQGDTDEDAFFVICDETNNTPLTISQNKLRCRIGLATQQSSRFLEFTIEQDTRAAESALAAAR